MRFCMYNVTTAIKIGGIETFYWEISKELKKIGHEVDIVTANGKYIKYPELNIHQFNYISRNKIPNLGNRFRKWGERISFFKNAYPYIKKQKYDYILIHKPLDFFISFFIKKINPNSKTIFVSGGEDFYGFDKFFAKYIDFMFAVSRSNAELIKKRYNTNVKVLHNGVDVKLFRKSDDIRKQMRKEHNLENKKVMISVGRVVGWKGFQLAIEALREIRDLHYVLIGDGEYLEELKELTKKYNLQKRVTFTGMVENKLLYHYLNMADIFIQPSIGHEAFGITIVEAMACGLTIVASKNGGIVDIIKDRKNGYLFETGNIKEMKEKIKLALTKSIDAREYVKNNFTWEATVKKLINNIGTN